MELPSTLVSKMNTSYILGIKWNTVGHHLEKNGADERVRFENGTIEAYFIIYCLLMLGILYFWIED